MTAGMAAPSPAAVATSASEIPGATTARLAEPCAPIPWKEFMTPTTVPKRPMNGQALAVVARNGRYRSSWATSRPRARRTARAAGQRSGRGRPARSLGSFDDTDRATGCQHFRPKKSGFSLTSRMRHPYNRLVVRAVPAMVILAALLSVAAASGSDARTAVDAFVARLGEVNVADLVIEQTLTLFDPCGRHPH